MRNKSGIYKIVAICASVIVALAMLVPTVTSAVGLSAANNSNHNAASAPSSATSTRSTSDDSYGIDADDIKIENADSWGELKGRNLEYGFTNNSQVLHLKPKDSKNDVNGKLLIGNGSSDVDSIYYGYDGKATLINQIKIIVIDEDMTLSAASQMFYGFGGVQKIIGLEHVKFSNKLERGNAYSMFSKCENLRTVDGIKNWDMTNVKNAHSMFEYCDKLKKIDLSGWKNAGIEDTIGMFRECSSLEEVDIFPSTEGKLKTIEEMFFNCHKLSSIPGIEEWNTNNINDMYCAFYMTALKSLDLSKWFIPTANVPKNPDYYSLPSENEPGYLGVVLNNTLRDLTYVGNFLPHRASGVWRKSTGKSAKNPGENIELNHKTETNYMRIVRDYIEVKFENKTDKKTIKCVADVLQGNNKKYNLGNANFVSCKDESGDAEGSNAFIKDKPIKFETIKNAMGIINGDTVTWDVNEDKLSNYIKKVTDRNNTGTGVYYLVSDNKGAKEVTINNGSDVPDSKISEHELVAWKDITFTANVTHKQKPKPPVPTPPAPQPQPTPTPTPEPGPTPEPSPEPTPDDSDILPDITPKPDLNINSNNNFVHPFNKAPQSVKGDDVQNNKLQHSEINGRARLGVKEYVGGNSGTCKCVCPNLPKDAKSRKSNKSVRKSSNKATPCKSGNNYSWLGIGGLIISWLIMLLIGFIVGYKMRKKRDVEQIDENQSAIKDQSL